MYGERTNPEEGMKKETLKQEAARLARLEDEDARISYEISEIRDARAARRVATLVGNYYRHVTRFGDETYRYVVSADGAQATMLEVKHDWRNRVRSIRYTESWDPTRELKSALGKPSSAKAFAAALDRALDAILREVGA